MGVLVSKDQSVLLENFEDCGQSSPPSGATRKPRQFLPREFDPRSPSAGIDRTPIQVTPQPDVVSIVDPRSPTCGIDRTPIQVPPKPEVIPVLDPRSPTVGIERTPIVCFTPAGDLASDGCVKSKAEVLDSVPRFPENELDSCDDSKDLEDQLFVSCESYKTEEKPVQIVPTPTNVKPNSTKSKTAAALISSSNGPVPYPLSPASNKIFGVSVKSSSSSGVLTGSPRSPLAPRNFASGPCSASTPHGLVRRKQAIQVERLRNADSPLSIGGNELLFHANKRLPQYESCDKENM